MMLYTVAVLLATFSSTFTYKIEYTRPPVIIGSYCPPHVMAKCPQLPPFRYCAKWYKPKGQCCPVCDCRNEHGDSFNEGTQFLAHVDTPSCTICECKVKDGVKQGTCFKQYCLHLECPPAFQIKVKNSCCKQCSPIWKKPIRTFPPIPGGPFPPSGGGFPKPNGGFPKPNGGFPKPNGGFPKPSGGGFPPFGDEAIEGVAEENLPKKE